MPGISKAGLDARLNLHNIISLHGVEKPETCLRIFGGIEGRELSPVLPFVFPALPFRIHFLDMGRIQKHNFAQFRSGWRGNDPALKSVMNQFWDLTAVVNVSVG